MPQNPGPKCGAKRHGRAETCTLPAGWGTDHVGAGRCRKHLGSTPNVAKAAAREQAEQEAREVLAQLDVRPVGNPLLALRRLGGQVIAWQEACARLVNKLEDVRYSGQVGGMKAEQLRAEVGMYQDAMRQSASVLASLSKLEIDERLAVISERRAGLIAGAFAESLDSARAAPELAAALRREFARRLLLLSVAHPDGDPDIDGALMGVVIPPR